MGPFGYRLERTVEIGATPETVSRFFTDSARWAKWWGAGSSIDARVSGKLLIRHPGGTEALGRILEIVPVERIVFTYGYANGKPMPPESSTVTIGLEAVETGTKLHLLHEFSDEATRDEHIQGWRFQLSFFANAVCDDLHAGAAAVVDAWFEAWAVIDSSDRQSAFARISSPDVQFRDRYSALRTSQEVSIHAGAAQRFMPGVRMQRKGEIQHCQGMVVADWTADAPDGRNLMSGTNVFALGSDGRINSATGFVATLVANLREGD